MGEKIATRNAYGQALAELANQHPEVVCFDADLAGATMSKFFLEAHPDIQEWVIANTDFENIINQLDSIADEFFSDQNPITAEITSISNV